MARQKKPDIDRQHREAAVCAGTAVRCFTSCRQAAGRGTAMHLHLGNSMDDEPIDSKVSDVGLGNLEYAVSDACLELSQFATGADWRQPGRTALHHSQRFHPDGVGQQQLPA